MSILTISVLVLISIVLVILLTSVVKLNAFVSLFLVSGFLAITALPDKNLVDIIKQGFGNTMGSIGFLIIPGAIIAVILEKSGGAIRIAEFILSKTGERNAASAMGITGFIAGLPIFCDSGYIILSGLARSFSAKARVALPLVAFVLATSLYSVHCLIPTHPGALAASGILNANIGHLIVIGILFAIPSCFTAYFWIKWRLRNEIIEEYIDETKPIPEPRELPSVFLSFLPVIVPLLLISIVSFIDSLGFGSDASLMKFVRFMGQPVIALFIGAFLSLFLIKNRNRAALNALFDSALEKAGPILIVIAAGGMFGMVIKETNVGMYVGNLLMNTGLGIAVPFLITAILKTAQGSSTVAIITAASLVSPMLEPMGLGSETGKLLTMISMGAGSMMISHANDAYFWVVSRFSGIHPDLTLKVYSSASVVMGITVFACVFICSLFFLG